MQWLNGREVAPAHRHTSQVIRFIVDGAGSYSNVEGDKVYLEHGDFSSYTHVALARSRQRIG
ncbi:MAG: hypothetical protein ACRCYY_07890 [Trueperaceae bacterium]